MEVENFSNPLVAVDIPADIIYEIFLRLRLTAKSLLHLRCVCKLWCNIIDSVLFANKHFSERAAADEPQSLALTFQDGPAETLPLRVNNDYVIEDSNYPILELCSDEDYGHLNLVCYVGYGLLCFQNRRGETFLCNPLRKEVLELPLTVTAENNYSECYGMGFDSITNTYKIVRVVRVRESTEPVGYLMRTEVYSLGSTSWREIPSVPSCGLCVKGVSAYGEMYWLSSNHCSLRNAGQFKIISFDFGKEEFMETPLPDFGEHISSGKFLLFNLRGSLAIAKFSYDPATTVNIEIWVLKDYNKKEWVRENRISIPDIKQTINIPCWVDGSFFCTKRGVNICFLDLKRNRIWEMQRPGAKRFNGMILGYRGSLLSLKNFGKSFKVVADERCNFLKTARLIYTSCT